MSPSTQRLPSTGPGVQMVPNEAPSWAESRALALRHGLGAEAARGRLLAVCSAACEHAGAGILALDLVRVLTATMRASPAEGQPVVDAVCETTQFGRAKVAAALRVLVSIAAHQGWGP